MITRMPSTITITVVNRCLIRSVTSVTTRAPNIPTQLISPIRPIQCRIRSFRLFSTSTSPSSTGQIPSSLPPLIVKNAIVSRPLVWRELVDVITAQNWSGFGRLRHVQDEYNQHRKQVLKEYLSMGDFILHNVFGAKRIKTLEEGKFTCKHQGGLHHTGEKMPVNELVAASKLDGGEPTRPKPSSPQTHSSEPSAVDSPAVTLPPPLPFMTIWTPNHFPYGVESDIQHDLLWSSTGDLSDSVLRDEIEKRLPTSHYEVIYFVNPMYQRSIKDVFHAHVFWRLRSQHRQQPPYAYPPPYSNSHKTAG